MRKIHLLANGKRSYCGIQFKKDSAVRHQTTTFEDWCECKKCLTARLKKLHDKETPERVMPAPNTHRYSGERIERNEEFNHRHGFSSGSILNRDEAWSGAAAN